MTVQIDGEIMRIRRLELRLSQEKLAEKAGLSQSLIAKIEKGDVRGRKRDQQDAIAKALGISVQQLCGPASLRQDSPQRIEVTQPLPTDAGAIDDVLASAWDVATHRVVDVLVVRSMMVQGTDAPSAAQARTLLNAAAKLRARGAAPTTSAVALEVAKESIPPSAAKKTA